jgi:TolA-binding protein
MLRHGILLIFWLSLTLGIRELSGAEAPVKSGTLLAQYEQALASFNAGRAERARAQFEGLLTRPDLPLDLRDNCSYWLGEAWYAQKAWLDALACFLKVLEQADANKEEDARLKIALCWQNLGEPERACTEARTLLGRFPTGESAPRARRLLERCPPGE